MSRAYGWNARFLLGFESAYGNPPTLGEFHLLPFISSDLDSAQGLIESNVLGLGRDPTQPYQDVINVDGDIVVPVDLRNIGHWLKAVFGSPETGVSDASESGTYEHVFTSGAVTLPSLSLELGMPELTTHQLCRRWLRDVVECLCEGILSRG